MARKVPWRPGNGLERHHGSGLHVVRRPSTSAAPPTKRVDEPRTNEEVLHA